VFISSARGSRASACRQAHLTRALVLRPPPDDARGQGAGGFDAAGARALEDPTYVEAARPWPRASSRTGAQHQARVKWAWRQALARDRAPTR